MFRNVFHCLFNKGYVVVSAEDLKALQDKVAQLIADKKDADDKTSASNDADTVAAKAAADAAQAKQDEAVADAKASSDLVDLKNFIDNLA